MTTNRSTVNPTHIALSYDIGTNAERHDVVHVSTWQTVATCTSAFYAEALINGAQAHEAKCLGYLAALDGSDRMATMSEAAKAVYAGMLKANGRA